MSAESPSHINRLLDRLQADSEPIEVSGYVPASTYGEAPRAESTVQAESSYDQPVAAPDGTGIDMAVHQVLYPSAPESASNRSEAVPPTSRQASHSTGLETTNAREEVASTDKKTTKQPETDTSKTFPVKRDSDVAPEAKTRRPRRAGKISSRDIDTSALTPSEKLAYLQFKMDQRRGRRRTAGRLAVLGAGVVAMVAAYNAFFGGTATTHGAAPSPHLPSPKTAIDSLQDADRLVFATGEVTDVSNATARGSECTYFDVYCQDLFAGSDISTTVKSGMQYSVDGQKVHYRAGKDSQGRPIVIARIDENTLQADLIDEQATHPYTSDQELGKIVDVFSDNTGAGDAIDRATRQAEYNTVNQTNKAMMADGDKGISAIEGALAADVRRDVKRLAELERSLNTDSSKENATVVESMIADDRPIGLDFGADGFSLSSPTPVEDIHAELTNLPPSFYLPGFNKLYIDVTYKNSGSLKISKEAKAKIAQWQNSNVIIVGRSPLN